MIHRHKAAIQVRGCRHTRWGRPRSAVAQALVAYWAKPVPEAPSAVTPADGPVFAWAGSLSPLSATQVSAAADYQRIPVDTQRLASDPAYVQTLQDAICGELIARVVLDRIDQGTPLWRMGIAGGDTSSHTVQALRLWGLSYQSTLYPGVTLSQAHSSDPTHHGLELMLKGGQMGGVNLFVELFGK